MTRFQAGDEVFSQPDSGRDGAYAEFTVVSESLLAKKPSTLDHVHAAGVPLAAMTAWQALFEGAQLKRKQRILIHAGAGGVGSFAVQFAKWKGAYVIATCSTANVDFVKGLGADEVIDYRQSDFTHMKHVDAVLDTLGGEGATALLEGDQAVRHVGVDCKPARRNSRVVEGPACVRFHETRRRAVEQHREIDGHGQDPVVVETVLPLEAARQAQELSMGGHVRGKIVLKVDPKC